MTAPDTHRCPGGCGIGRINPNRLACRDCWYRLPRGIRAVVMASWQPRRFQGEGRESPEHRRAVAIALEWYRDNPLTGAPSGVPSG